MPKPCPKCQAPVRRFFLDADGDLMPVLVDPFPRLGTLRRLSVLTDECEEVDPFPGGWVRHVCEAG